MTTKRFHLGDILSITTGHLVGRTCMEGVYEILNWLTGENLFTHQLPEARQKCLASLEKQFPALATEEIKADTVAFCAKLERYKSREDRQAMIKSWLEKMAATHGEWFEVAPAEGVKMGGFFDAFGDKPVIGVEVGS